MKGYSFSLLLAVSFLLAAPLASAFAQLDPDAGELAPDNVLRTVAGPTDADCDIIGDYSPLSPGTYRYRGNVYHFDVEATLNEIQMELAFTGRADLHVAIHQKQPNGTYKRYLDLPDVVISQAMGLGAGVTHFYSTAEAIPPMPAVTLEEGFDYAIAFAWGANTIANGRDQRFYPVPFRAGQVLGLVGVPALPPDPNHPDPDPLVPNTFPGLSIFDEAAYSMQLCFVSGACCNGAVCSREIGSICLSDGRNYRGDDTTCDGPNPCPCTPDGECDDGNECTPYDSCENETCVNDWRKGYAELIRFTDCLAGPDQPIPLECACFDFNADDHVDMRDVALVF